MRRREFIGRGLAAAAVSATRSTAAAARRPNVLLVLADQWRGQALPSAGNKDLRAPNLARLAAEGLCFNSTYAADPVCSPSRASLFTGRFAHATGVTHNNLRLPVKMPTLASELLRAGYRTGYIGKWHLDGAGKPGFVPPGARRHGFEYWAAFNRGHRYYDSIYFLDDPEPIRPGGFEPDYQTELAARFIRKNRARPFFLVVSWGPPHPPRKPPARWAKLYEKARFSLRYNVPAADTGKAERGYAAYYGLCSALDWNLGRLLGALEESNLGQETIVVFTSDHGDMLGSHGLEGKGVPFEEAVRIPLLLRYPRAIPGGGRLSLPASNVDLMPTLLSLAGVEIPAGVQGVNLATRILGRGGPRPEAIYCQGKLGTPREWRMVMRGLDKVVVDRELRVTRLYNLGQDPYEMTNLVEDKKHRRKRDEMAAILRDWMRRTGDRVLPSGLKLRD